MDPETSRNFVWEPCGTIPGVPGVLPGIRPPVTEGHAIMGVPHEITSLSITSDGKYLASAASELIVWQIAEPFEDSAPTWISSSRPEVPTVHLAANAELVARSGDGRIVFTYPDGESAAQFEPALRLSDACPWPELRFSPDGNWLVGAGWRRFIEVFSVADFALVHTIPAPCGTRVTFTADGTELVTSGLARFRTNDWQPTLAPSIDESQCADPFACYGSRKSVAVSPDGTEVATSGRCASSAAPYCTRIHRDGRSTSIPELSAAYPSFSPEGHWLVAGAMLVHLPSGATRSFDPNAIVALFAPNGDVIAGDRDFGLTRYCRR